ncbi:MAG: leucine-rich repeat protein [Eubacteriales bacterium]|nr:leucine-rich repeat protein [Eubacteriales bacterium]
MKKQTGPLGTLPAGTVLARRYTLERMLGRDDFGTLYAARDRRTGRRVTVREYLPAFLAYRDAEGRIVARSAEKKELFLQGKEYFLEEAKALSACAGVDHMLRVYGGFEAEGTAFQAEEPAEGVTFREYLQAQGGRLEWEEVKRLLLPVMETLEELHSRGMIHGNLSPEQLLRTQGGELKLWNFGMARYSIGVKSREAGRALTDGFSPPEQYARNGWPGVRADIYAMAAICYAAVTGQEPLLSIDRTQERPLPRPSAFGAGLSSYEEAALLKGMATDPEARFQSMRAFREAFGRTGLDTEAEKKKNARKHAASFGGGGFRAWAARHWSREKLSRMFWWFVSELAVFAAVIAFLVVISPVFWLLSLLLAVLSCPLLADKMKKWKPFRKPVAAAIVVLMTGLLAREISAPEKSMWGVFYTDEYQYTVMGGKASILNYTGDGIRVEIPSELNGASVRTIESDAFSGCRRLEEVIVPEGVTDIGSNAFRGCIRLARVSLPDTMSSVGAYAFSDCLRLTEVIIPDRVEKVEVGAFDDCLGLERISIPDGCEIIDIGLEEITIEIRE